MRKIGIYLILIGFGVPLVLYFFQDDGVIFDIRVRKFIVKKLTSSDIKILRSRAKEIEEKYKNKPILKTEELDKFEFACKILNGEIEDPSWGIFRRKNILEVNIRKMYGLGLFIIFIGIFNIIFSFFPRKIQEKINTNVKKND